MMLVSCSTNDVSEIDNSSLMQCAPEGAIFINKIRSIGGYSGPWIELKFRNECFLVSTLCGDNAVLTKIDCDAKK